MDPAAWSYDSVDGVVRNSRGYPVLNVASHTEVGHRAGRLAAQAPNMLDALRKIAQQSCRPLFGSDGKRLDDVHETECAACIARLTLRNAVTYNPVR